MRFFAILIFSVLIARVSHAQNGIVRGHLYDEDTGEPVVFANVVLEGTGRGANTDFEGFFSIAEVPPGAYDLVATYLGYDTVRTEIRVGTAEVLYRRLFLSPVAIDLRAVDVSGRRERARTEVQAATIALTPNEIKALPATGGEADLAQYLTVLPGIIQSGDQGGQLYIRGGSPVQNKVLLDGMTIYQPFHSIGLFSVFETETIRSAEVLTAGFNAEHGGRISAVMDIKTREGNKKRFSGLVSAGPFQAKALFEGPIKKLKRAEGGSISFLFTGKHSYLDESSRFLYDYARDENLYDFLGDSLASEIVLPYNYTDLYGKLSFNAGNGSRLDLFGFHFSDQVDFSEFISTNWTTGGGGANFTLVPTNSNLVMNGTLAFSTYNIQQEEAGRGPRSSAVTSYTAGLAFTYFGNRRQLDYGFEFHGFNTDFRFVNPFSISFQQRDFTTELSGYFTYRQELGSLIVQPGLRLHFYASQPELSVEPRLGLKYRVSDGLRLRLSGGLYSQNLVSTVNDLDVVNYFIGFLAGPQETIFEPGTRTPASTRLQKAWHGVAGWEVDLGRRLELTLEGYYKGFTQLIEVNRNKRSGADPDFSTETGEAYGLDFTTRYEDGRFYAWLTYSLGYVFRDDGAQRYPAVFDRRHNVNVLLSYTFGKQQSWEAGVRWNLGTGFPFTQTQGFYQAVPFSRDKVRTDVLTGNYDLGTILSQDRNAGRLPYYHRLDLSLKKNFRLSRYSRLEILLSLTNAYNRDNVFFVDRISNNVVRQLPLLPSLSLSYGF